MLHYCYVIVTLLLRSFITVVHVWMDTMGMVSPARISTSVSEIMTVTLDQREVSVLTLTEDTTAHASQDMTSQPLVSVTTSMNVTTSVSLCLSSLRN